MEKAVNLNSMTSAEIQNSSKPARFNAIDIAKGILILAVVFSHAWFANSDILGDFFPYAMPAFFFLSGYTYKTGRGYFKNLGKRVIQLLIPYLCFGTACNLLYPVYASLTKTLVIPKAVNALWVAMLKADALNMLMGTPMWFLVALFTASIIFFAVADYTRGSLVKTVIASAILVAAAFVIDIVKDAKLFWYIDYAPFGAAMMLIGSYFGGKKLFAKITPRGVIIGVLCIAAAAVLNHFFPGSGKTSVVQYVVDNRWYGVFTAFAIAITGSIGILMISRLIDFVPAVRSFFRFLGRNSIWILCIHYILIMLVELQLFNMHILSNSIMQVVAVSMFGYGKVSDTAKDLIVKILVALFSVGISLIYALIHSAVKGWLKKLIASKRKSAVSE